MSRKTNNKQKMRFSVITLLAFISLCVGAVGAKYIFDTYGNGLFRAKEFYFESNLLMDEEVEYILNPNSTSISFTLTNAIDELRMAEDDIEYVVSIFEDEVNVTNTIFDELHSSDNLDLVDDNGEYSINGKLIHQDESVTVNNISLKNLVRGKTYTVVATGTAGYVKTLEAKFTVSDSDKNLWKYLDIKDDYVLLTVWTENLDGDISIEFPEGLIPDGTDNELSDVYNFIDGEYKKGEFVDETNFDNVHSSHVYRFFIDKDTGSNLLVNSFIVKKTISNDPLVIVLGEVGTLY